jgi:gamma-glutamyltranspeptidase/glutathione hydrolase
LLLPKGIPLKVGDRLTQTDLATSLEQIAKQGPDVFYKGLIAQKISKFSRTQHGLLTSRDLSDYQVKQRTPISATFRGHRIVTAPPPSAGGIMMLQSLKIIEGMPIKPTMPQDDYLHIIAEVFKHTFADRYTQIGDPDFETLKILPRLNESYITKIREDIDIKTARPATTIKAGTGLIDESPDTTHLSLIDSEGNAVSATITLNYFFGAGIMVPGTGIILNDEMGDFDPKGENGNPVLPKRRPISSLSPTIVFDGSKPMLALGAAGGPYIITGMTQAILNRLVLGWSLRDSIFAPKIHHQFSPDILRMENGGFANEIISDLRSRGHSIDAPALYAQIPAVEFDKAKGQVTAVIDPRDEGGAVAK